MALTPRDLPPGTVLVTNMAPIESVSEWQAAAKKLIAETMDDDVPRLRVTLTGHRLALPPIELRETGPGAYRAANMGYWRVVVLTVPEWHRDTRVAGKLVVRIDAIAAQVKE